MRRLRRNPFHYSDLGGAFLAFAPKFGEDEEVARRPLPEDSVPAPRQRTSMLMRLINALRRRRRNRKLRPPGQEGVEI